MPEGAGVDLRLRRGFQPRCLVGLAALGLRAGTDEIQITHIAKDLLRR